MNRPAVDTEVHHFEEMPLDDFRADARDATVRWA